MKLKVGDLVVVLDGTHDARLPPSRTGLIVEAICEKAWNEDKFSIGIFRVMMTNGELLKFHEMFLRKVEENEKQD
jgi:hypothetical protein